MYENQVKKVFKRIRLKKAIHREVLAEFTGTFLLIVINSGLTSQSLLSAARGDPTSNPTNFGIHLAGIFITYCIFISWGVDGNGGHINPAVSLAFCTVGKLPWWKLPFYLLAQYFGAFCGAAVAFGANLDAINNMDPYRTTIPSENRTVTANLFATYPQTYLTTTGGLFDQITGTALLLMLASAVTDEKNIAPAKSIYPFVIGQLIISIGLSYGLNCGYAINPARDLGPRIFSAVAGYGIEPFSFRDYNWWWIPIVGPHVGAIVGLWTYMFFIGAHWKEETKH